MMLWVGVVSRCGVEEAHRISARHVSRETKRLSGPWPRGYHTTMDGVAPATKTKVRSEAMRLRWVRDCSLAQAWMASTWNLSLEIEGFVHTICKLCQQMCSVIECYRQARSSIEHIFISTPETFSVTAFTDLNGPDLGTSYEGHPMKVSHDIGATKEGHERKGKASSLVDQGWLTMDSLCFTARGMTFSLT